MTHSSPCVVSDIRLPTLNRNRVSFCVGMHEAPAGIEPGTRRGRRALGVGGVLYTLNTVGIIVCRVRVFSSLP